VEAVQERPSAEGDGITATTTACHVAAVLMLKVELYVPGVKASPVSASRKFEEAAACGV
jgi:hypothetical protein